MMKTAFPIIDYNRVFARIPEIMRLDLTFKNNAWEGQYYITGEPHKYKRDKLKVKLYNGIWIYEQGGESMNLVNWLVTYGGCATYKDAFAVIRGNDAPVREFHYTPKEKTAKNVPKCDFEAIMNYDIEKCPLFTWMSGLFGEERTRETWKNYNVCTDSFNRAVFWYVDNDGHVLHDKRIPYLMDGHRDKRYGASRKYKVGDGYSGRCLFGEHRIKDAQVVNIVEGEKSALLATAMWGDNKGLWCATGGKTNIRLVSDIKDKHVRLFPDMDAVDEWKQYGEVVEWWKGRDVGEHSDIGDMIVQIKNIEKYS